MFVVSQEKLVAVACPQSNLVGASLNSGSTPSTPPQALPDTNLEGIESRNAHTRWLITMESQAICQQALLGESEVLRRWMASHVMRGPR